MAAKHVKKHDPTVDEGFSGAEYNAVAMGAQLRAINMLSSEFHVASDCVSALNDWKLSYDRRILSCSFDDELNFVAAIFQFEVLGKLGRRRALRCVADYGLYYSIPDGSTEAAAKGFCQNVGSFAAYPYFRTHVATMAANAGIMLPPLPAIASTAHIPKKAALELSADGDVHDEAKERDPS
jgi:hypothetical protein